MIGLHTSMTKIAVFIPTYRPGGIDVIEASIKRQKRKPDSIIIADELNRYLIWDKAFDNTPLYVNHVKQPGNKRNLCANYNVAAGVALTLNCDLFISLQDYIWLPENGIQRFEKLHKKNPEALLTGLTHISSDPDPSMMKSRNTLYSIFKDPYFDKPKKIGWEDVRKLQVDLTSGDIFSVSPGHWEANWAAVPTSKFEKGIYWDEEYDHGIAYENVDFAEQCVKQTKCEILLDSKNEAISLPHKDYFEGEREEIIQYTNRWLYENKWAT